MDRLVTKTLLAALAVGVAVCVLYLFIDQPAAQGAHLLRQTNWHTLAKNISLLASSSFFTTLLAVGFIVAALDFLNNGPSNRARNLLYICVCVSAAIVVGDVLKDIFGRARPPLLFEKNIYGFYPLTGEYLYYSFPSGHTLRIFSSMVALGLILPRLRYPALLLAITVGCSRIVALKHYPSDVLMGAFIGTTAAIWGWRILHPYGCASGGWGKGRKGTL